MVFGSIEHLVVEVCRAFKARWHVPGNAWLDGGVTDKALGQAHAKYEALS